MSINLLQHIVKNLGYPELKKVDPNTQDTVNNNKEEDKLSQAAIPAVLIILYKYTRSNEGAEQVLSGSLSNDWLVEMLGSDSTDAVQKVADYAGVSRQIASERMELIAKQAVGLIQEAKPANTQSVKDMVAAEKNNILVHLPAALHMGDLLNDTTIDDRVNKMEGPVSSFMNALGGAFSKSEKAKED
jgi:hypothetical protein